MELTILQKMFKYACFKKCSKCGEYKQKRHYHRCRASLDNCQSYCKNCVRQYYQDNKHGKLMRFEYTNTAIDKSK